MKFVADDAELKSLNLPLVPMIDVFMNLLCFFLIAGHFKEVERDLEANLPKLATKPDPSQTFLTEFWIRVKASGTGESATPRIWVQDTAYSRMADVEAAITTYSRNGRARSDTVILAPEPDAHAGWVMEILGILNGLQFRNINFKR